jgi:hypothetical protein
MEEQGMRFAKREKIFFPVEVSDLGQTDEKRHVIKGYIIDISRTGALLYPGFSHLLDHDILICFKVSWLVEDFRLKARVVRCDVSSVGISCGVKFFDLSEDNIQAIEKLIRFVEKRNFQDIL